MPVGHCSLPIVLSPVQWRVGCAVRRQAWTKSCLGCAFQVAQTSRALHWVMKALRDGGFGSEEGIPAPGECVALPAAGTCLSLGVCGEETQQAGFWRGLGVGRLSCSWVPWAWGRVDCPTEAGTLHNRAPDWT